MSPVDIPVAAVKRARVAYTVFPAGIVISADPLKATPFISLGVVKVAAEAAVPVVF